jgi:hypothetical protein
MKFRRYTAGDIHLNGQLKQHDIQANNEHIEAKSRLVVQNKAWASQAEMKSKATQLKMKDGKMIEVSVVITVQME